MFLATAPGFWTSIRRFNHASGRGDLTHASEASRECAARALHGALRPTQGSDAAADKRPSGLVGEESGGRERAREWLPDESRDGSLGFLSERGWGCGRGGRLASLLSTTEPPRRARGGFRAACLPTPAIGHPSRQCLLNLSQLVGVILRRPASVAILELF